MKLKKPKWKDVAIAVGSFLVFLLLFRYWDEVKAFIAGIFS